MLPARVRNVLIVCVSKENKRTVTWSTIHESEREKKRERERGRKIEREKEMEKER